MDRVLAEPAIATADVMGIQSEASQLPRWASHAAHMELGMRLNQKQRYGWEVCAVCGLGWLLWADWGCWGGARGLAAGQTGAAEEVAAGSLCMRAWGCLLQE